MARTMWTYESSSMTTTETKQVRRNAPSILLPLDAPSGLVELFEFCGRRQPRLLGVVLFLP